MAIVDGQVCGFIGGGLPREAIHDFDAEIYGIYLLDAAKRQGIGRLLLHKLVERLRANGLTKAFLWVLADNPSRTFYEHLGAEEITQKIVPLGGANLLEIAYGWQDLATLKS